MTEHMKFYSFEQTVPENRGKTKGNGGADFRGLLAYNCRWNSLLYAVIGFLLGGASVTANLVPCGIGWLAAMAVWDKRRLLFQIVPVLLGVMLWTEIPLIYTAVLLLLMIFLGLYTPPQRMVRYLLPLIVFATTLAVRGLSLFFLGISDLLLISIIVESIVAAGLSLVFLAALEMTQRITVMDKPTWEEILCIFLLATGVILGLTNIVIFSMPLSEIAMRLLILIAALLGGVGGGATIGTLMGMIPFLAGESAATALGVFAFSGLLGGVFHKFGRLGVVVGFLSGNLVLTFYFMNSELVLNSVIASVIAAALLLCIPNKVLFRAKELFAVSDIQTPKTVFMDDYISLRLKEAGTTLERLKNTIVGQDQKRTEKEDKNIDSILSHLSRTVCAECGLQGICWEMDLNETYRDILTMFATVESKGTLASKDVPDSFKKRCSHRKEIVASVNCLYEMYQKNDYWQQQTRWSKSLLTLELSNASHFLTNLDENVRSYVSFREILDKKLSNALRNNGFNLDYLNLSYVDSIHLDLRLKARYCKGEGRCGRLIGAAVYELTGRKYTMREYACGSELGKTCTCRFCLNGTLRLDTFSQQIPKENETLCGDYIVDFLLPEAKHCFVLSDGMGVGEEAKKEAEATASLIQGIFESGFDRDFAAGILNYLTMNKEKNETYATADICMVDLKESVAEFVKLGASPSFICSPGKGVKVVAGNSMPYGEAEGGKPKIFREKIDRGDIVIMVSDGVLETGIVQEEMEYWLTKTVNESQNESIKIIGERVLSGALAFCGGKAKDDMSISLFVAE